MLRRDTYKDKKGQKGFKEVYTAEKLDQNSVDMFIKLNNDHLSGVLERSIEESKRKGAADDDGAAMLARFEKVCQVFMPDFAKANMLAKRYRGYYQLGTRLIYILAAFAVIIISTQFLTDYPLEIPGWKLLAEIFSMVTILGIIEYGNRVRWHERWINYRLLAEHCRFAIFVAMVGKKVSTKASLKKVNIYQLEDDDSLFSYFRGVRAKWEAAETPVTGKGSFAILKDFVRDAWLANQRKFHKIKGKKHKNAHKRLSFVGESLFALTLAAAILHYVYFGGLLIGRYLKFAAIAFPVTGSTLAALRSISEHNKLARTSEEMVYELTLLQEDLAAVEDINGLIQVSEEALELTLKEVSNWHVLIGFHKPEAPA